MFKSPKVDVTHSGVITLSLVTRIYFFSVFADVLKLVFVISDTFSLTGMVQLGTGWYGILGQVGRVWLVAQMHVIPLF